MPEESALDVFERLHPLSPEEIPSRSFGEQVFYYVTKAGLGAEMDGYSSVFDTLLNEGELEIMIAGLRQIGEPILANAYAERLQILKAAGYYPRREWHLLPPPVRSKVDKIGDRISQGVDGLDEKLRRLVKECR